MCDYDVIMSWTPRLREASWFMTGHDGPDGSRRYADRHFFLRVEQDMNGTSEWTVELRDCHRGSDGRTLRTYRNEQDARTAVACIYALTRHLGPLDDRFSGNLRKAGGRSGPTICFRATSGGWHASHRRRPPPPHRRGHADVGSGIARES